jgi:hypothetical protein
LWQTAGHSRSSFVMYSFLLTSKIFASRSFFLATAFFALEMSWFMPQGFVK